MTRTRRDFNASSVAYPAIFFAGIVVIVLTRASSSPLTALGWGAVLGTALVGAFALIRLPLTRRVRQLKKSHPTAVVEVGGRGMAMCRDIAALNASDHGDRDTLLRAIAVVFDAGGLSSWRASDSAEPEWSLPWPRLSEPVVGSVNDSFWGSSNWVRGLSFVVDSDTPSETPLRLRIEILGGGFLGLFALSTREITEIAERCIELRAAARRGAGTP